MHFCTCLSRLRDTGRSGQWAVLSILFVGYGGTLLMIYFCGIEGKAGKASPRTVEPNDLAPRIDERALYGVPPSLLPRE